jgi:hypothetical protein
VADMVVRRTSGGAGRPPQPLGDLAPCRFHAAYHPSMAVLRSRLDPGAPENRANHDAMAALVADLRDRQAQVAGRGAGGDDRSIEASCPSVNGSTA